jgi:hypothetical protein
MVLRPYVRVVNHGPPEVETEFHQSALGGRAGFAEEIARAMEREKREVTHSRFLQVMNVFAPGMLDRMFQGMVRERI